MSILTMLYNKWFPGSVQSYMLYSKQIIYISFVFVIMQCNIFTTYAQQVNVNAGVDSNHILIGDQVEVYFEVIQPRNYIVHFPGFTDTIVANVEIIKQHKPDTNWISEQKLEVRHEYTVSSYDSGFYYIPPLKFPVKSDLGRDTITSESFFLEVSTIPLDTAKQKSVYGLKGPYEAPLTLQEILPYILYGLSAVILVLLIIYYRKRKKKNKPVFKPQKPPEPPHRIALRELEELKKLQLWQHGKIKAYYTQLSDIIRQYIERKFQINAMELTSDEILNAFLGNQSLDSKAYEELEELLTVADLVKFAKFTPQPGDNENNYTLAYNFIRRTIWEGVDAESQYSDNYYLNNNNTEQNENR